MKIIPYPSTTGQEKTARQNLWVLRAKAAPPITNLLTFPPRTACILWNIILSRTQAITRAVLVKRRRPSFINKREWVHPTDKPEFYVQTKMEK